MKGWTSSRGQEQEKPRHIGGEGMQWKAGASGMLEMWQQVLGQEMKRGNKSPVKHTKLEN